MHAIRRARPRSPERFTNAWEPGILLERCPIRSGRQVLGFVTDQRPAYAGIDPYNFYIDATPRTT